MAATPKVGQYYYAPRGRGFVIYQYTKIQGVYREATPARNEPYYHNGEAARKRVYELNGWNYKPRDK